MDDDEAILRPVSKYFRGLGCAVVTSVEAGEAERALERESFDLVILDLALTPSGREGLDLLRIVRARRPPLPAVLLSAYVSPELEREALELGVGAVLSKPQPLPNLAQVALALIGKNE